MPHGWFLNIRALERYCSQVWLDHEHFFYSFLLLLWKALKRTEGRGAILQDVLIKLLICSQPSLSQQTQIASAGKIAVRLPRRPSSSSSTSSPSPPPAVGGGLLFPSTGSVFRIRSGSTGSTFRIHRIHVLDPVGICISLMYSYVQCTWKILTCTLLVSNSCT